MDLYAKFVKKISYPLINWRDGIRGIYKHLDFFENTQYLPLDELERIQFLRLKKIIAHAYENTTFYKKRFDNAGFNPYGMSSPEELESVPILTKEDIRENLPEMLAQNFSQKELHSSETGGTTGVKIVFYRDNYCLAPKAAATIRCERWTGWDIGERVGLVWPARQDYVGAYTIKAKIKNDLTERYITLPAAVLSESDIHDYCQQLKKYKPTKIRCFPYSLYLVARYILENSITGICTKGVIATGEPLYDHQREAIEKAFNCRVFDSYGSRETALIAQECEYHNGMHINMECVFIEFLDENGNGVGRGELGRIIVTDLLNYGMPLIRYDLGDLGVPLEKKCPCGRSLPLMGGIEGRVVDEIVLPSGKKVSSITLVLYLVDNGPLVGQVQIIQDAIDHLTIKLTNNPLPDETVFKYYLDTTKELLGKEIRVDFEIVDEILREPSGKYRFVKSLL